MRYQLFRGRSDLGRLRRHGSISAPFHNLMRRILRLMIPALLLTSSVGKVWALPLPVAEELERQYGLHRQSISVVEPHESTADRPVLVRYVGLPMNELLTRWFGESWKNPEAEIIFLARDGYRSAIPGTRLKNFRAYLAFGRDDGSAFVVDNPQQNQKHIPLDPYYLVWDNRDVPELLGLGSDNWPYQVNRIELYWANEERALLPHNPSQDVSLGFAAAKEYCLTCHRIRGLGGEKYPEDLVQASCRWQDTDLKEWIADPSRLRPGTVMPPLNRFLPTQARNKVIEQIASYLNAMKAEVPSPCSRGTPRLP